MNNQQIKKIQEMIMLVSVIILIISFEYYQFNVLISFVAISLIAIIELYSTLINRQFYQLVSYPKQRYQAVIKNMGMIYFVHLLVIMYHHLIKLLNYVIDGFTYDYWSSFDYMLEVSILALGFIAIFLLYSFLNYNSRITIGATVLIGMFYLFCLVVAFSFLDNIVPMIIVSIFAYKYLKQAPHKLEEMASKQQSLKQIIITTIYLSAAILLISSANQLYRDDYTISISIMRSLLSSLRLLVSAYIINYILITYLPLKSSQSSENLFLKACCVMVLIFLLKPGHYVETGSYEVLVSGTLTLIYTIFKLITILGLVAMFKVKEKYVWIRKCNFL